MPSFSRAMSMIGRFFAVCEISMSDLGFWCWEAGMRWSVVGAGWEKQSGAVRCHKRVHARLSTRHKHVRARLATRHKHVRARLATRHKRVYARLATRKARPGAG